jgi:hypothetical protein
MIQSTYYKTITHETSEELDHNEMNITAPPQGFYCNCSSYRDYEIRFEYFEPYNNFYTLYYGLDQYEFEFSECTDGETVN